MSIETGHQQYAHFLHRNFSMYSIDGIVVCGGGVMRLRLLGPLWLNSRDFARQWTTMDGYCQIWATMGDSAPQNTAVGAAQAAVGLYFYYINMDLLNLAIIL